MSQGSVEFIVTALTERPKPVACLDTCVYLDFFDYALEPHIQDAFLKLEHLSGRGDIYLISPSVVVEEYERNVKNSMDRLRGSVKRVIGQTKAIRDLFLVLGGADPQEPLPHYLDESGCLSLLDGLQKRVEGLLRASYIFNVPTECEPSAFNRMKFNVRPAQRGKDSLGDCLITEGLLSLTRKLRDGGFAHPVSFVSSNIKDYADVRARLHPGLEPEFAGLLIDYYSHVSQAVAQIRRSLN
jgi:PIN domain-containing protein